jgi:hypothetical protein
VRLVDGDLAVKSGAEAFQFGDARDVTGQAVYGLDRKHGLWAETMPSARGDGQARTPRAMCARRPPQYGHLTDPVQDGRSSTRARGRGCEP